MRYGDIAERYLRLQDMPMRDEWSSGDWRRVVAMSLCFGVIIAIIFTVYKMFTRSRWAVNEPEPLDVAKARLARGDITKEEYDEIKNALKAEA